tara:strand:+ start:211 stop:378 length:168 start_codon:yes stop_codon:yes gene_type:complete
MPVNGIEALSKWHRWMPLLNEVRPKSIAAGMHGTFVKAFAPTPTPNAETVTGNGL